MSEVKMTRSHYSSGGSGIVINIVLAIALLATGVSLYAMYVASQNAMAV